MTDQTATSPATPPLIDIDTMSARFRDYGLNTLSPVLTMMMSGVFATAALAFADIMRTPDLRWIRLSMWLWLALSASNMIMATTGTNLLHVHPRPGQIVYQLAYAFVFSAAFACLPLSTGGPDGWLYALALPLVVVGLTIGMMIPLYQRWLNPAYYPAVLQPILASRASFVTTLRGRLVIQSAVHLGVVIAAWTTQGKSDICNVVVLVWMVVSAALAVLTMTAHVANYQLLIDAVERIRRQGQATSP